MLINKDIIYEGYNQKFILDFKGFRLTTNTNSGRLSALLEGYSAEFKEWVCLINEYDLNNLICKKASNNYEDNFKITFEMINKLYDYINKEYYKTEILKQPSKKLISLKEIIIKINKRKNILFWR
jgi:hypothetical protein